MRLIAPTYAIVILHWTRDEEKARQCRPIPPLAKAYAAASDVATRFFGSMRYPNER